MMELNFNEWGYLPAADKPIDVSLRSLKQHFGLSSSRRLLVWQSVETLLDIIQRASIHVVDVWIDGSFISLIDEPNDVDIIVFLAESELRTHRQTLSYLDSQLENLDIKWVPSFEESTSLSKAINELERMRWFALFSSDREDRPKGIISLNSFSHGSDN